MGPPPPCSPLFPYTTLFRSRRPLPRRNPRAAPQKWGREDSNLRRLSRRVYSPFPLAARAHPREARRIVASARETLRRARGRDRKSTRLNSSHMSYLYAVFCLNGSAPTLLSTLSLHDALPISSTTTPAQSARCSAKMGAGGFEPP